MKSDDFTNRLVLIKSLYKLALEQSNKAEPLNWFSILTFHDTVELFFELASEHLGVSASLKDLKFARYWDSVNTELKQKGKSELTQRISMEKLNNARVAFKHHGTSPSKATIEESRINVTNFLEENTSLVFGIKFSEISLIDLIQSEKSRISLNEAKRLLLDGKKEEAVDKIALAFEQLVDDYENSKRDFFGRSMFSFGDVGHFSTDNENLQEVKEYSDEMKSSLEKLQKSVKILTLGLDYRKYVKFKFLTARAILKIPGGDHEIQRMDRKSEGEPTDEDIEYCIDFIIESAIVLKEFDFELKFKKPRTLEDLM